MSGKRANDAAIALSLVFAVFLWGGNNTGTKLLVSHWPPIWTGGSRFFLAGLLLLGVLRWSDFLGKVTPLSRDLSRQLWWRGGLVLAVYIVVFNTALRFTSASHVALYLGAAPVWALLWEFRPGLNLATVQRYGAAFLALSGVFVLFWPSAHLAGGNWVGEVLGLGSSVLWTAYGRQCRALGGTLSGAEVSAHTMWRAGVLLLPLGLLEISRVGLELNPGLLAVQSYCIVAGGVVAFAIWANALRAWPASKVLLFNNLIPLSTTTWAHLWLREAVSPTFWVALVLVIGGVVLAQWKWLPVAPARAVPPE